MQGSALVSGARGEQTSARAMSRKSAGRAQRPLENEPVVGGEARRPLSRSADRSRRRCGGAMALAQLRWRPPTAMGHGGTSTGKRLEKQAMGGEKKALEGAKHSGAPGQRNTLVVGPRLCSGGSRGGRLKLFPTWLPHPTEKSARKTVSWSWEKPTRACSFYAYLINRYIFDVIMWKSGQPRRLASLYTIIETRIAIDGIKEQAMAVMAKYPTFERNGGRRSS